jgi:hypothetical protein
MEKIDNPDIVPIIGTGVLTPAANLPLVSTTPVVPVAKFAAGVIDTGGKFSTGVVDTSGAPWLVNISANFRKNDPYAIFTGLGEGDSWKNQKQKISWRCPVPLIRNSGFKQTTSGVGVGAIIAGHPFLEKWGPAFANNCNNLKTVIIKPSLSYGAVFAKIYL